MLPRFCIHYDRHFHKICYVLCYKRYFFLEIQEFCRFNFPAKISLQYFLSIGFNFSIVGNSLTNLLSGKFEKKRSITTISGDQGLFLAQKAETIKRLRVNLSRVARAIITRALIWQLFWPRLFIRFNFNACKHLKSQNM